MKKTGHRPVLHALLEEHHDRHNHKGFIETDPIQIPHRYTKREDIEISAFLTSMIAWGKRVSIINNAERLMTLMDHAPHEFVTRCSKKDLARLDGFVHRTFNSSDCCSAIRSLANIYRSHGGLRSVFEKGFAETHSIEKTLAHFRDIFFTEPHAPRFQKHISDIRKNSAAKRLNLFLMWMCRKDTRGVHFGIWDIPSSALHIPLDVHCGNVGRQLGLLQRTQNDWKAVVELTSALRSFDANDPVKYDFALFGIGVSGTKIN